MGATNTALPHPRRAVFQRCGHDQETDFLRRGSQRQQLSHPSSYEAERRIAEQSESAGNELPRGRIRARLTYRMEGGRPAAMSALALFWPMPGLARLGDPWRYAKRFGPCSRPVECGPRSWPAGSQLMPATRTPVNRHVIETSGTGLQTVGFEPNRLHRDRCVAPAIRSPIGSDGSPRDAMRTLTPLP